MRRRTVIKALAGVGLIPVIASCSSSSSSSTDTTYSLTFDASDYTTETKTVNTGSGTRTVKYRFYRNNVYVRHPVNYKYQSLNVSVPVEIDGKAVDASGAPIMFAINVGGYTSSSSWGATGQGGGMSAGAAPGGFGTSGEGSAPSGAAGGGPGGAGAPSGAPTGGAGAPSGAPTGGTGGGAPGGSGPGGGGASPGGSSVGLGSSMASYWTSYDDGEMALASGYVVVEPGCRGRDQQWSNGRYYGKAPAMIVDLKAAIRYLRYNKGRIPGNTDWIVTSGGSAGGALSTLVAASGNSTLYHADLTALGAADADDNVFLSASYSPITDLDHADMQYEWMWGSLPDAGGGTPGATSGTSGTGKVVNQTYSKQLTTAFAGYLKTLALSGINGYGTLTADNYAAYLLKEYLRPAAARALGETLTATERETYLAKNTWITWSGGEADFTWDKFLAHVGSRSKGVPAFDAFDLSATENSVYGDATHNARHFTLYSLRHATGNAGATLASDLPQTIAMMNPLYHLRNENPSRARHWWIRTGTLDTNTAHTVVGNLAALTTALGDTVNSAVYWDGGHAVNYDSPDLMAWIAKLTGYTA
ncbi:MAG TPA: subtype B tannase [Trebonia sp.]|nr:subtype B tannase [Trebonia sp.]